MKFIGKNQDLDPSVFGMQVGNELHLLACLNQSLAQIQEAESRGHQLWFRQWNPLGYWPYPAAVSMRGLALLQACSKESS